MFQIIVGAILIGLAYQASDQYSPVLFVQGMILINLAIYSYYKKKNTFL